MKLVSKENLNESRVKLSVEVSAEEFDKYLDQAFEKVVKDVKVAGFRPGKMPKNMFISRFGYEALYEEALHIALNDSYPKALEEANLNPISDPELSDVSEVAKDKEFTYSVTFDVWPPVHLGAYKEIEVKALSTVATDEAVLERVQNMLKQKGENVIKDGKIENGDTAVIDFEGFVDGVAFPGGKAENYELEIGSGSFIPGFEEQLVGMITGESKDINVTFPENYRQELAGKATTFKIMVHEVKTKVYPELDDELVGDLEIENVKTVDEYKAYLKDQIHHELTHQAENHLVSTLIKTVIDNSSADIPESIINREVEEGVKKIEVQAKQYGMPVEALLQYSGVASLDEYKEKSAEYVRNDIMKELCFEEIAKLENIEVENEEVTTEYNNLAGIKEDDTDGEKAKKYRETQKKYPIYNVIAYLKNQKVLEFLKENAKIIEE